MAARKRERNGINNKKKQFMKTRINFDKNIQMHLCCSEDSYRPVFEYIYFKDGFAIATDALVLVKNKLTEISTFDDKQLQLLEEKFIHHRVYREILKSSFVEIKEDGFLCKFNMYEVFYPFAKTEFKPIKLDGLFSNTQEFVNSIGLDAKKLLTIAKAMPHTYRVEWCLNLSFCGELKGVIVKTKGESVGLIMPVQINH